MNILWLLQTTSPCIPDLSDTFYNTFTTLERFVSFFTQNLIPVLQSGIIAVSYTHLDVYKRQTFNNKTEDSVYIVTPSYDNSYDEAIVIQRVPVMRK